MNNIWTVKVREKNGNIRTFAVRGPYNDVEARAPVERAILEMRVRAIESGAEDPELKVVEVVPAGEDEVSPPGTWMPPGAKEVNLSQYAKSEEIELVF